MFHKFRHHKKYLIYYVSIKEFKYLILFLIVCFGKYKTIKMHIHHIFELLLLSTVCIGTKLFYSAAGIALPITLSFVTQPNCILYLQYTYKNYISMYLYTI